MTTNYTEGPSFNNDLRAAMDVVRTGVFNTLTVTALTANGGALKVGTYTAVAGDDTAGEKDIVTGLSSITAFFVQIFRSGVLSNTDAVVTAADGTLTVADGAATYDVTAGDVIMWAAYGEL